MPVKLKPSGLALSIALILLAPAAVLSDPTPTVTPTPTTTTLPEARVAVCHQSLDEGERRTRTLRVAASAVSAHLAHGDTLGVCP